MAKFKAEKLDLDLELTTLDGDVVSMSPKTKVNTTKTLQIIEQWGAMEEEQEAERREEEKAKKEGKEYKAKKRKNPFEIIAIELEMLYSKDAKWFMDNFDVPTLGKIMTHVAETMGGLKKKETNSESSSNSKSSTSEQSIVHS